MDFMDRRALVPCLLASLALSPLGCELRARAPDAPLSQAAASRAAPNEALDVDAGTPAEAPAAAPAAPPAARIPEGCDWNLSGLYQLAEGPVRTPARYKIEDDGARATVSLAGEAADAPVPGQGRIELRRTPEGFVGELLKVIALGQGGPHCQVRFPAEILACARAEVVRLALADEVSIDERCGAVQRGAMREVVLVRTFE